MVVAAATAAIGVAVIGLPSYGIPREDRLAHCDPLHQRAGGRQQSLAPASNSGAGERRGSQGAANRVWAGVALVVHMRASELWSAREKKTWICIGPMRSPDTGTGRLRGEMPRNSPSLEFTHLLGESSQQIRLPFAAMSEALFLLPSWKQLTPGGGAAKASINCLHATPATPVPSLLPMSPWNTLPPHTRISNRRHDCAATTVGAIGRPGPCFSTALPRVRMSPQAFANTDCSIRSLCYLSGGSCSSHRRRQQTSATARTTPRGLELHTVA